MRAVEDLRRAGIRVIMLTGDHPSTAEGVAAELAFDTVGLLTGPEIDDLSDQELASVLSNVSVFARVTPAHKSRIVGAL